MEKVESNNFCVYLNDFELQICLHILVLFSSTNLVLVYYHFDIALRTISIHPHRGILEVA